MTLDDVASNMRQAQPSSALSTLRLEPGLLRLAPPPPPPPTPPPPPLKPVDPSPILSRMLSKPQLRVQVFNVYW